MSLQSIKIYSKQDFEDITQNLRVIECKKNKSHILPPENFITNIEDLTVSDSLSCSYCSTEFDNKIQQRQHYKSEWHRFNLKQHLHNLESVSESDFNLIIQNVKKKPTSNLCLENQKDTEIVDDNYHSQYLSSSYVKNNINAKKLFVKEPINEFTFDDCNGKSLKADLNNTIINTLPFSVQHSKIFFENGNGKIFGIYRCLLYNKKNAPKMDDEIIDRVLECGKKSMWTIIIIGGGHFAGAVFSDGNSLVHKTLHYYTVRAKQGSLQQSKVNRCSSTHLKSAGSNIRRHNEANLLQRVQEILISWSSYIKDSSLILYRAVGTYNYSILFNGKQPPFDKSDLRLRQLPFPTSRPTYNEVKRVYDLLSTVEIYTNQLTMKTANELSGLTKNYLDNGCKDTNITVDHTSTSFSYSKIHKLFHSEQHYKNNRSSMDRAKPRKSPHRPLPDIVAKLARSSSESEIDVKDYESTVNNDNFVEENFEVDFQERLLIFEHATPNNVKKKQRRRVRDKVRRN